MQHALGVTEKLHSLIIIRFFFLYVKLLLLQVPEGAAHEDKGPRERSSPHPRRALSMYEMETLGKT